MMLPRCARWLAILTCLSGLAAPPAGYHLEWADEFDGTALDLTRMIVDVCPALRAALICG
jgi:hypothetical protein